MALSSVCKDWSECFHDSQLWSKFTFKFDTNFDEEGLAVVCADKYSEELKDVVIQINQTQPKSLERAIYVLEKLIALKEWKLNSFAMKFTAQNPLCFNGKTVSDIIKMLLRSIDEKETVFPLKVIDLSRLQIGLDDTMIQILTKSHNSLRILHVQNFCLVDNITAPTVLNLVKVCRNLQEFYVFYHCLDDDVIKSFSEPGRADLKVLSIMCTRHDKFTTLISSSAWELLKSTNSNLDLTVKFHSTMPRHIVNRVLCTGIPATRIDLHLYSWVENEVLHIANTCSSTLEFLSFHTSLDPNSKANQELLPALLQLVSSCPKLEELHCHCKLPQSTIETILSERNLKQYTLYSEDIVET